MRWSLRGVADISSMRDVSLSLVGGCQFAAWSTWAWEGRGWGLCSGGGGGEQVRSLELGGRHRVTWLSCLSLGLR